MLRSQCTLVMQEQSVFVDGLWSGISPLLLLLRLSFCPRLSFAVVFVIDTGQAKDYTYDASTKMYVSRRLHRRRRLLLLIRRSFKFGAPACLKMLIRVFDFVV